MEPEFHADENSAPNFQARDHEDAVLKNINELLLDTIVHYPALWNKQLKEYHDIQLRENCWMMIAAVLDKPVADCQKRWGQLRDSYTCERRKREKESRSGSGATKRKGFSLYNAMEFLQPHCKRRKNTFTNVASVSPVNTSSTLSTKRLSLSSVQEYFRNTSEASAPPVVTSMPTFPSTTSISSTLMRDIPISTPLFSVFPPTPPSSTLTASPNALTPPLPLTTATSEVQASTSHSTDVVVHTSPPPPDERISSFIFNDVSCTETSTHTTFENINYVAATPPARTPTPGQSISKTPVSAPLTPRSTLVSPHSPYSPYTDTSSSFSADDNFSLHSLSSIDKPRGRVPHQEKKNIQPKACYAKDSLKTKKIDPVEASFLTLSTVLQNHFQKPSPKESGAKDDPTLGEQAFANLIALELEKMDEGTKKIKKTRLLQVLYE